MYRCVYIHYHLYYLCICNMMGTIVYIITGYCPNFGSNDWEKKNMFVSLSGKP